MIRPFATTRLLVLFPVAIALCACSVPHNELLARDREECVQFGFQPGTDRFSDCLLKLDTGRHQIVHRH
jgi:hypothetical protein